MLCVCIYVYIYMYVYIHIIQYIRMMMMTTTARHLWGGNFGAGFEILFAVACFVGIRVSLHRCYQLHLRYRRLSAPLQSMLIELIYSIMKVPRCLKIV